MTRYQELDLARGLAVAMMIVYHFFYDLTFLGVSKHAMYAGGWLIFQRIIASTFLLVVGVSLVVSFSRSKLSGKQLVMKYLYRGLFVMGCGMLVTLATWSALPRGFVVFGILHHIGAAIILSIPLLFLNFRMKFPNVLNALLGVGCIHIGLIINKLVGTSKALVVLGITYPGFYTVDYFPIFPWFGVIVLGIFLGRFLYTATPKWNITLPKICKPFTWLGRKALLVYLLHQPVLIGLIFLSIRIINN